MPSDGNVRDPDSYSANSDVYLADKDVGEGPRRNSESMPDDGYGATTGLAKGSSNNSPSAGKLPLIRKIFFGFGHVQNDLCAAMWFSYLLVFLHNVLNFRNKFAGGIIFLGQIADALATPFIGIESDRSVSGFFGYGRRKSWHLIGTICVVISFPFLFIDCIGCPGAHDWAKFIYFAPFVVIFQFGWASVQIAHLALIPDLATKDHDRVELNAIRYGWTVIANLTVYLLTWLVLKLDPQNKDSGVGPDDVVSFRTIVFAVTGAGTVFSVLFHLGVKEVPHEIDESTRSASIHMSKREWFKEPHFYMVGMLYMSARLFVNLTQVYIPMYLLDTLHLEAESIGYIPLVVYLSGFVTSWLMKPLSRFAGNKISVLIGIAVGVGACCWIQFAEVDRNTVYGVGALLGVAGTILMVASLSVTNDLIGGSTKTGAFVLGIMSLCDKLSNGVAVMVVSSLQPENFEHADHSAFFRRVMVYVPVGACAVALICILLLWKQTVGHRRRDRFLTNPYSQLVNEAPELERSGSLQD